jgi:hypothetical protein
MPVNKRTAGLASGRVQPGLAKAGRFLISTAIGLPH